MRKDTFRKFMKEPILRKKMMALLTPRMMALPGLPFQKEALFL